VLLAAVSAACGSHPTAPAANAPPVVTIAFQGAATCAPLPRKPCTVDLIAQATDPDGDPLHYAWSGCASGTSNRATCTIGRLATFDAVVLVNDDHGHTITVTATATGINHPPGVGIGYIVLLPTNSSTVDLLGNIADPDEPLCGAEYCVSAAASGACGPSAFLSCSCLAGLEVEVRRTATSGLCTVTFTLKDSWEEVGTPSITFDVGTLRQPVR